LAAVPVIKLLGLKVASDAVMAQAYWLVALIVVPILAYALARWSATVHTASIVGVAFGAIVSPWATGLYSLYFASPWGIVPGMLGLVLELIHGAPGFKLAVHLGLIPRGVVSGLRSAIIIEAINGLLWASIYGLVGMAIDRLRRY